MTWIALKQLTKYSNEANKNKRMRPDLWSSRDMMRKIDTICSAVLDSQNAKPASFSAILLSGMKRPDFSIKRQKYFSKSARRLIVTKVYTTPEKFENAALILRCRFTIHNNPSRKRSFWKTLFKPEECKNADISFSCGRKHSVENGAGVTIIM